MGLGAYGSSCDLLGADSFRLLNWLLWLNVARTVLGVEESDFKCWGWRELVRMVVLDRTRACATKENL
jgi:hypothetical protein